MKILLALLAAAGLSGCAARKVCPPRPKHYGFMNAKQIEAAKAAHPGDCR